jgi:hypothetical protein
MLDRRIFPAIGLVAIFAIGLTGCGGGSSDHSSEWSSGDEAKVESEIVSSAPEVSDEIVACTVKGIAAEYSPSEVFEGEGSSEDQENVEGMIRDCAGDSSSSVDLYGGDACQDNLSSGGCVEEVEEKLGELGEQAEEEPTETYEEQFENEEEEEEAEYEEEPEYGDPSESVKPPSEKE